MKPVAHFFRLADRFRYVLIIILLSLPTVSSAELLDRVVAVVNDEVITLSDLENEGRELFRNISAKTPASSLQEALNRAREDVLDALIENRIISQKAKENNISVSPEEVENAFQHMVSRSGQSEEVFLAKVKESGMTEPSYKEQLKYQVLQGKLVSTDIRAKTVITEEEILDYYDTHYTSQVSKGGLYLLQIGFIWRDPKNPDASPETLRVNKLEARKKAEEVLDLANDGEDFKELAKKYSELPSAADGGDLGIFQIDEMAEYMREGVIGLKPGEISEIIETPDGYQFFKLLNNEDGTIVIKTPLEQVKEEIRSKLYEQRMKKSYDEWMTALKDKAYIQKLDVFSMYRGA